ncbi:MAG: sigma-70 family RNA polymerase sigma factor [Actinomycetota bacterium]
MQSRDELIEGHLPLVRAMARRFARPGDDLDDLEQAGAVGLILAVDRFDRSRGCPLEAYAVPSILWEMRRLRRDTRSAVRIPRRVQRDRRLVAVAEREATAAQGRAPTVGDLAARTGLPREEVQRILARDRPRPVAAREDGAPDFRDAADDRLALRAAMGTLGERERRILLLRFDLDLSQEQIGRVLGLSQVHVSRLIAAALARMREALADRPPIAPAPGRSYIGTHGRRRA